MTTPDAGADQAWSMLVDLEDEGEREARMQDRYAELAALPQEEDRQSRLKAMAYAEYAYPEDKVRRLTISRLRSWIRMDLEAAQAVVKSYVVAMDQLPGAIAMHRVALDQTLAREFSPDEQKRLLVIDPTVFGPVVHVKPVASAPAQPSEVPAKKAWWAFWKK